MKKSEKSPLQSPQVLDGCFAIDRKNIGWILIGLLITVIGFILMIGGGTKDPNVFTGEQMFSFRRIVLAPIFIFVGFIFEIWAIMHKKRSE